MRSLFCRININKQPLNETLFSIAVSSLSELSATNKNIIISGNTGFGQIDFNSEQNNSQNQDFIILSDSRIDNRSELQILLGLKDNDISTDEIIIKSYIKWGHDCTKYLIGDFAFLIWDKNKQELFCARDHFGVKPMFYFFDHKTLIISSEIKSILTQTDTQFSIDEQYIADSISLVKSEKDRTTFNEIKKIPPAHSLVLKNNKIEIQEYWKLETQPININDEKILINQFRELLYQAVECRIKNKAGIGSELSGGIDSSAITAMASKINTVKTCSHILPDNAIDMIHPFKDERKFIEQVLTHLEIQEKIYVDSADEGIVSAISQNISDFEYITQQNFAVFSDQLYEKAKQEGINILLSGFGGDEAVTSKSWNYLSEFAKLNAWNEIRKDLKAQHLNKFQFLKKIIALYLRIKTPKIYRLIGPIKSKKEDIFRNLAVNSAFEEKLKIKNRYYSLYEKKDEPSLQKKCIERISHPHVSQRLEYCSLAARKYNIEYVYPLLDKRLIEFYLSLPIHLKAKSGITRFIFRESMRGILPESIRKRNDKSGTAIPSVFYRTILDKENIRSIIEQAKENNTIKKYIDLDSYEKWFNRLIERDKKEQSHLNPGAFYNYLKLILFIEKNPQYFE